VQTRRGLPNEDRAGFFRISVDFLESPNEETWIRTSRLVGAEAGFRRAKHYGLKMAWGADTFGSPGIQKNQKDAWVARSKYYSLYEILVQATSLNAERLAHAASGIPIRRARSASSSRGAHADLVLFDGNPLRNVALLGDSEKNLKLIMKEGRIYKNTLR